jgi:hypothetical protein
LPVGACRAGGVRRRYAADVLGYVVGGLAVASIAIAVLFYYLRPAGEIWRGNASRMPSIHLGWVVALTPRTYPSALLCIGAVTASFALGGIAVALGGSRARGGRSTSSLLV